MAFEHLIGNNKIKQLLIKMVYTNNVLHSYLFVGQDGIGKSIFAKEFAKMILCSNYGEKHSANTTEDQNNKLENTKIPEAIPCNSCKSCIEMEGENNPDFIQINPEDGKSIKIEQVRNLQSKIAEKPVTSSKKVYIINDADLMTREAANCLLKTLEEPPEYAVIILIASNENKLLSTILSRCTKITFEIISKQDLIEYLKTNNLDANLSEIMLEQAKGSIGKLQKMLNEKEQYVQIEELVKNLRVLDITEIWQKAEVLYKSKDTIIDILDYLSVILYNGLVKTQNEGYINSINVIEETKKRIMANANYDMCIDYLLLRLCEENLM